MYIWKRKRKIDRQGRREGERGELLAGLGSRFVERLELNWDQGPLCDRQLLYFVAYKAPLAKELLYAIAFIAIKAPGECECVGE